MLSFELTPSGPQPAALSGDSLDAATRQLPPGLYTTFRTYGGRRRVLGLRAHLRRLYNPAPVRPVLGPQELRRMLADLLICYARELPDEARVRLVLDGQGRLFVLLEPLKPLPPEIYHQGVSLITLELHRRSPHIKSTAFIEISRSQREALAHSGAFEALMVHRGRILEGLTSNFFYVEKGKLSTARHGVLPGVTRRVVLHLAHRMRIGVLYRPLPLAEIPAIDEAFICSSSRGLVPVVRIDGQMIGNGLPGALTLQISEAYAAYVLRRAEPLQPHYGV